MKVVYNKFKENNRLIAKALPHYGEEYWRLHDEVVEKAEGLSEEEWYDLNDCFCGGKYVNHIMNNNHCKVCPTCGGIKHKVKND